MVDFSKLLSEYSSLLGILNRLTESETAILESIQLLRKLADIYPERFLQLLAAAMNNHGIISMHFDRIAEAREIFLNSYEIAKSISTQNSQAVFLAEVYGIVANNLGAYLSSIKKLEEAENYLTEARQVVENYAKKTPEMFRPYISTVLNNIAVLFCETNRISEAEYMFRKALDIRRDYVKNSENFFLPRVATLLNNFGIFFRRTSQFEKSEKAYKEALEIIEPFVRENPSIHQSDFVQILSNSSILYSDIGKTDTIQEIKARLQDLGISKFRSDEEWFFDFEYLSSY